MLTASKIVPQNSVATVAIQMSAFMELKMSLIAGAQDQFYFM